MGINNGIIVLNYNTSSDSIRCIEYLLEEISIEDHILIIDNKSTDHSLKILKDRFFLEKRVKVLLNNENAGYARGNNIGIDYFLEKGAKFITICNPDIIVQTNTLSSLYSKFEELINVVAMGPKMLHIDESFYLDCTRNFQGLREKIFVTTPLRIIDFFGIRKKYYYNYTFEVSKYVYMLSGAFMIFRREVFETLNGFDPRTFLFQEEAILFKRLHDLKLGEVYYNSEAVVIHDHTSKTLSPKLTKYFRDSEQHYLQHYLKVSKFFRYMFKMLRNIQILAKYIFTRNQ